jgi:glutamine synthetase
VLPAAVRYQTELALNLQALLAAGVEADRTSLDSVSVPLADLRAALNTMGAAIGAEHGSTPLAEAQYAKDVLLPAMADVRAAADLLEGVVADDLWPLPTYQEMLYIL